MSKLIVKWDQLQTYEHEIETFNGILFTGIAVEYYPNGTPLSEVEHINGLRSGWTREWYQNGQIKLEQYFIRTVLDGIFREWHENGKLKTEKKVEEAIVVESKEWNQKGELLSEFNMDESHSLYTLLKSSRENRDNWIKSVQEWELKSMVSIEDL
jgi:antitoxin component YwqK of YwqJK toxin-antitoxin module